jgi:uncharacterized SAM-binding protein YcdF (DUF218 family)
MFMLKKILTPFLLPPGIFIIFSIFTGFWFLHKKKWKAGITTLLFGCFAWALSIAPVSYTMFRGLEAEYGIPKNIKGDVIILLGAPPDGSLFRFVTAARLQKRLDIPIIMSGANKASKQKDSFAIRFLIDLGVPEKKIIEEDKSRDTFENAKFSQKICSRLGFTDPILVTSAYHMKRAIMSFGKVGLKVVPFPSGFKSWQGKHFRWDDYLPGDFREASIAISEYMGIVFYKFVN